MTYLDFSEINSVANRVMEYLNPFKFDGSVVPSDKSMAIVATFAVSAHIFGGTAVINDSFKYVTEQEFFAQEQHLIKTTEAAVILRENWDLSILVFRAELMLKNYFGLTPLYLEEIEDNKLLMSVATDLPPSEALKKLRQFDDEWWIKNESLANGKLCIDVVSV